MKRKVERERGKKGGCGLIDVEREVIRWYTLDAR